MQCRLNIALVAFLLLLAGGLVIGAQKQQAQPAADKADPLRPYASPPAAKSVEIGDFYMKRDKLNAALSRFQEALQIDAHYAPAYRELGKLYEKMGFWQKSLDAYQKYLNELPSAKDPREAKHIHKAIARLQKEIVAEGPTSSSRQ